MKNGTCPRCQSQTVYARRDGIYHGHGGTYVKTATMNAASPVISYVCVTCGYFEDYVADPAKLAEVAKLWEHVTGPLSP